MLTLTSRSLRRDIAHVAVETGVPATAAAIGGMAGCAALRSSRGVKAAFLGTACVAGGSLMALQGRGKVVPYAGAGLVFGSLWGLLGR